jgi:hypothetical protein
MHVVDIWARARRLAQQVESTTDPQWRCVLENMRDLWMKLGREAKAASADDVARKSERLSALEDQLRAISLRRQLGGKIVLRGAGVTPGSKLSRVGNTVAAKDI